MDPRSNPAPMSPAGELARAIRWSREQSNPFDAFNSTVIKSGAFWSRQRAICRALVDESVRVVAVPAGHSVGKSFMAARVIIAWLTMHRDSLVISTSPSNNQLSGVLWKEVRRAFYGAPLLRRFGRITADPEKLDYGLGWHALGFSTNKPERLQGHHSPGPMLVVVDEASGIEDPEIWATLKSLKPYKQLLISNPIRPDGPFFEICRRAESDPAVRLIRIPSTDSPDIELERSPRGLADKGWLDEMRADFGEGSLQWLVRVLAQFPAEGMDQVIPAEWLDLAGRTAHVSAGPFRLAIDLATGSGGDRTVLVVRDDNGIVEVLHSKTWTLEVAATQAALLCQKYGIAPQRVSWDSEGPGVDFANRLRAVGIQGARAYRGGASGGDKFTKLRAATAWAFRLRLDPKRLERRAGGVLAPQHPFAIPPDVLRLLKPEATGLRYHLDAKGRTALEPKDQLVVRLKHSPDFADAVTQSFAFAA